MVIFPSFLQIHLGGQGVGVLHEETAEEERKGCSSLNCCDLNGARILNIYLILLFYVFRHETKELLALKFSFPVVLSVKEYSDS